MLCTTCSRPSTARRRALSWYQLTIEPNTAFASKPPTLPEDDTLWDIYEQGHAMLTARGYQQYEISASCQRGVSVPPQPQLLALRRLSGDRLRRPRQGDGPREPADPAHRQGEAPQGVSGRQPPLSGQPMAGSGGRSAAGVLHEPVQTVRAAPRRSSRPIPGWRWSGWRLCSPSPGPRSLSRISATAGSSPLWGIAT